MASEAKVKKPSIKELMAELDRASDQPTKRKIRSQLRAAGHTGGLGKRKAKAAPVKRVTKGAAKPKGKRASKPAAEPAADAAE